MTPYSQLRAAPRVDLGAQFPLERPLSIYIEPTNVCNFRCVMCPESREDYAKEAGYYGRMSFDLYRKLLEDIRELGGVESLKLYFEGEPFLNPMLTEMIWNAKTLSSIGRVEVTTNGSRLDQSTQQELIDARLDYLQVSIYGCDEDQHEKTAGVKSLQVAPYDIWRNVLNLRNLRDAQDAARPFIYAKYMHESPAGEFLFRAKYHPYPADEIGVQYRHNWGGTAGELIQVSQYAPNPDAHSREFQYAKEACAFPFYMMAVHANGIVSACCVDWNSKVAIGDATKQSLKEIWEGPALQELQRQHLAGRRCDLEACRNCDALYTSPDFVNLSLEDFDRRTGR